MPRPRKCRKVCTLPSVNAFVPVNGENAGDFVILGVDEYEAIRLIDYQGFSQEQCGEYMKIARTTVQQLYASARKKLAEALVEGYSFRIEGGQYELCDGEEAYCECGGCLKHRMRQSDTMQQGGKNMRIAIPYENGKVFQHFGHTQKFKIYDVADGKIIVTTVVDNNGQGHGALAGILKRFNVDTLICGGIGGGAQTALQEAGIVWYGGVQGDADEAAAALIAGNLQYDPQARCDHHDEHHHGEHACGDHGCGSHGCSH